jgi:transposase-like protein
MEPKTETRTLRERHEEAFKRDCVALLEKRGKRLRALAEEMGISHWNLRDWRRHRRRTRQGFTVPTGTIAVAAVRNQARPALRNGQCTNLNAQ